MYRATGVTRVFLGGIQAYLLNMSLSGWTSQPTNAHPKSINADALGYRRALSGVDGEDLLEKVLHISAEVRGELVLARHDLLSQMMQLQLIERQMPSQHCEPKVGRKGAGGQHTVSETLKTRRQPFRGAAFRVRPH